MNRENISSGTPWEEKVGYSRAVKIGDRIYMSGTVASDENGNVNSDDAYEQACYILEKIRRTLESAGATMENVVRTRMYLTSIEDQAEVGRAHAKYFKDVKPASILLEVKGLTSPEFLVEIEVDAVIL